MPGTLLTTASRITCPHQGQPILATSNATVTAGGMPVLLESDIHVVAGCPFTIGPKYSPCVRIEWSAGAANATNGGVAPRIRTSIGTCYSPEGLFQGVALILDTQPKASAA